MNNYLGWKVILKTCKIRMTVNLNNFKYKLNQKK